MTIEQKIDNAKKQVKEWELSELMAKQQQVVWKNKLAKLIEQKGKN